MRLKLPERLLTEWNYKETRLAWGVVYYEEDGYDVLGVGLRAPDDYYIPSHSSSGQDPTVLFPMLSKYFPHCLPVCQLQAGKEHREGKGT